MKLVTKEVYEGETEWTGDFCASITCPNCGHKYVYVDNEEWHICDDCKVELKYQVRLIERILEK